MTKIQVARDELARLEGEVVALERQVVDYMRQRAALKASDVDDQVRGPALSRALEATREKLQFLQNETDRARQRIRDLESERENLKALISGVESRGASYGEVTLAEVQKTAHSLVVTFRRCGNPENREYDRLILGVELWAKGLREELASLPNWRKRLADYGEGGA